MTHLGDVREIRGCAIPPVDVVTGGSPCQDLSAAGKRAGLAGERSGLYMEQIRIIKELRHADGLRGRTAELIRPRFMVWENVPGAFSSNRGEDFRAVLEEAARIKDPGAVIPGPPGGKWRNAGCVLADGWSLAWRVHDAQFWGVPQRRRRIALVADFGGHAAPEVLFVRKSVCGDIDQSAAPGEAPAPRAGGGAYPAVANCLKAKANLSFRGDSDTLVMATGQSGAEILRGLAPTLNCNHEQPIVGTQTVRRLTPLECERLQDFPDGWTDIGPWTDGRGKLHRESSDSARYKAIGNSIALPFWKWLCKRISALYERDATLGSLFDGVGGFPLCWERVNGPGSCLWASEIEEFPMAVTNRHFGSKEETP